jgi:hypothetical protein
MLLEVILIRCAMSATCRVLLRRYRFGVGLIDVRVGFQVVGVMMEERSGLCAKRLELLGQC